MCLTVCDRKLTSGESNITIFRSVTSSADVARIELIQLSYLQTSWLTTHGPKTGVVFGCLMPRVLEVLIIPTHHVDPLAS